MKLGRTLAELATELDRQIHTRKDFIAPQASIQPIIHEGQLLLDGVNGHAMPLTEHAHGQMADHLGVPKRYYDRMRTEQPMLLAENVRTWLHSEPDTKRMLRTLDGQVRGVLSPRFRPLDNYDLLGAVLPTLIERKAEVVSSELTDTRLYIKAILPALSDELPPGLAWGTGHNRVGGQGLDRGRVVAAVTIQNSDVGASALAVEPSVFTTWCTNLAIMKETSMRKHHLGRAGSTEAGTYEVFTDATKAASDKAFWLQVRDVTVSAFDERVFRAAVERMRATAEQPIIDADIIKVVERTVETLALPPASQSPILTYLASGGDLSQWGLSSAITRYAADVESYDDATSVERAGGALLALSAREWGRIAGVAAMSGTHPS